MTYHLGQWSSTFFTGTESFEHLDCLRICMQGLFHSKWTETSFSHT